MSDIRLVHGDCVDAMQALEAESIDMVLTSPPYDNLRTYNGYTFDFESIAAQLYRVLKPGGVIVWVVADATIDGSETGTSFRQVLHFMSLGLNLHDTMIWRTTKPPLTHKRYEQEHEYMFVLSKGPPMTFNPIESRKDWPDSRKVKLIRRERDGSWDVGYAGQKDNKIIGNVWNIPTGGGHTSTDDFAVDHPAPFPEALARDHLLSWSNPGDWVLDPFVGSGTTAKMCEKLDRNCIGIDISAEYIAIAEKRVAAAKAQLRMPL